MYFDVVVLAFVLYAAWIDAASVCRNCFQQLKFNSSDRLNASGGACPWKLNDGDLCMGLLMIDFANGDATGSLDSLPESAFVFSNGNKISTNSTTIWLAKDRTTVVLQTICRNSDECVEDIDNTYRASLYPSLSLFQSRDRFDDSSERIATP